MSVPVGDISMGIPSASSPPSECTEHAQDDVTSSIAGVNGKSVGCVTCHVPHVMCDVSVFSRALSIFVLSHPG